VPQPAAPLIGLLTLAACAYPRPPSEVVRVLDGERERGGFVSPYAYEHFVRAELAVATGDDETAVDEYRMARSSASDDPLLAARLAETLDRLGRPDAAARALEEAEAMDPQSEALWLARARIAQRAGETEAALEALVAAREAAPRSTAPVLALAELLRAGGSEERAAAALSRVEGSDLATLRARLALATHRRDAARLAEVSEQLLQRAPLHADDVRAAIQVALSEDRPNLALRLARALHPEDDLALLVRCHLAAGDRAGLRELLASVDARRVGEVALARHWLEAGDPARAEAHGLAAGDEGRVVVARARLAMERFAEAALDLPGGEVHEALAPIPWLAEELRARRVATPP